jgi:hypothetical protein
LVMRRSFCSLLVPANCFRGGDPTYMASSGARSDLSVELRWGIGGRVVPRVSGGRVG